MIYSNVKFGADPELFLTTKDGAYKSAIGLIGGSKERPRKLDELGAAVQEDNVAVEFNIAPSNTKKQFVNNIEFVMKYLADYVGKQNLTLCVVPAAQFPEAELADPRALVFGCDPDYNVWTRSVNHPPEVPKDMWTLRSCGGHVHVSWSKPEDEGLFMRQGEELIKAFDVFLGAASIVYDGDTLRRKLYGKAGAFRFKPYGVEYRTLSNFWIKSPDLVGWVYDQAEHAIDFLNSGGKINDEHMPFIHAAINTGDETALLELQKYYPF